MTISRPTDITICAAETVEGNDSGPESSKFPTRVDLSKSVTHWDRRTKIKRVIWDWFLKPVFLLLPRPCSRERIALLRLMGAQIGDHCLIEAGVNVLMPWNLHLAPSVAIGRQVEIYNYALVEVDTMTVISQYSYLCTGTHDYTHPHMPLIWKPIHVGSECWVAAGVFIAPGVVIGSGSVIGARSVVTKSMPDWMVCAGNPCKSLKPRVLREAE